MTEENAKVLFLFAAITFSASVVSFCVGGCFETGRSNTQWEAEAVKRGVGYWDVDAENNRRFQWRTTERKAGE